MDWIFQAIGMKVNCLGLMEERVVALDIKNERQLLMVKTRHEGELFVLFFNHYPYSHNYLYETAFWKHVTRT